MIHRYIPSLTWDARNLAYLILSHEYKHGLQRVKKPAKRIKNNQFNIKWYFNRILKAYYQATKLSHLTNIESRLDVILFRTNWFKNKEAVRKLIKNGLIKVNNKIIQGGDFRLFPGDVIIVGGADPRQTTGSPYLVNSNSYLTQGPTIQNYLRGVNVIKGPGRDFNPAKQAWGEWYKIKRNKMAQNAAWLEINNNTRSLVVLKLPKFSNIPYPFNLHKFYV